MELSVGNLSKIIQVNRYLGVPFDTSYWINDYLSAH
jgi:hypothetical protein